MDIPYNTDFYFDEHLREVPVSEADMLRAIEFLKDQSREIRYDGEQLAKIYGLIGVYSRIMNQLEDSKKYLSLAIEINRNIGNAKSLFVNELRLAHTYQWEKNFQQSNQRFKRLLKQAEGERTYNPYLDFTYQHAGKNLFDQREYQLALHYLEKALEIRKKEGQQDLIASTEFARRICNENLEQAAKK